MPEWLSRLIYPVDKNNLDILRLMHFAALALLCWRFLPSNLAIFRTRALRPLVQCGEYALVIYCVGVLLSFAGHGVLSLGWNGLVSQTLVTLAGLVIMSAVAALLTGMNRAAPAVHPRPL